MSSLTRGASAALDRTPLRVTLVAALVALVAVALTATALVVTASIRGYLVGQVDQDLAEVAQRLPPQSDLGGGGSTPFETPRDEYIGVADMTGNVRAQATSTTGVPFPALEPERLTAAGRAPFTVSSVSGRTQWRVLVQPRTTRDGQPVLVVRGISLADVGDTTRRLVVVELLVGVVVLVSLGLLGYAVVRRSLRPLGEVETVAAAIVAGDLSRRVPGSGSGTEIGRVAGSLNAMLSQIEAAFRARERSEASARSSEERMRRFVADASHELRTPLTSIRGFAELYRQGAVEDPRELARVMRLVESEAARMGLLVEDLLLLARLDQQRPLDLRPVDLLAVVADVVHAARATSPDREIGLAVHGEQPVVLGDDARLHQVVSNLVTNALTHTPDGTPVTVSLEVPRANLVSLTVADEGPGLAEEERGRVFERFYRSDASRSRRGGDPGSPGSGTGLGLAIVAALVAAHGGRVGLDSVAGRGSRFLVELPLYAEAATANSQPDVQGTHSITAHTDRAAVPDVPTDPR